MLRLLKKAAKRLKHEIVVAQREIRGIIKERRGYLRQPPNQFTTQGYEVITDFLDKKECDRLMRVTDSLLSDRSYAINDNCYLLCRKDIHDVDLDVQQIMNAQEIDDKLAELFDSHILEEVLEQRTGEQIVLQSISIKIDNPDTQTKRSYHTDGLTPTVYKVFIYLSDVNEYGDGPYTLIPGSHRHIWRRLINYVYGWGVNIYTIFAKTKTTRNFKEDFFLFYSDRQAHSIFGKAGTMIISNQQLVHKGWHQHDKNRRYAIICYLIPKKNYNGQAFSFGRTAVLEKA